jgi:hypothetical protein
METAFQNVRTCAHPLEFVAQPRAWRHCLHMPVEAPVSSRGTSASARGLEYPRGNLGADRLSGQSRSRGPGQHDIAPDPRYIAGIVSTPSPGPPVERAMEPVLADAPSVQRELPVRKRRCPARMAACPGTAHLPQIAAHHRAHVRADRLLVGDVVHECGLQH